MRVANLTFTKTGWESFKKLTKKEQKDFVKARIEIKSKDLEKELKNVPYGKYSGDSTEIEGGSKRNPIDNLGSGDSSPRQEP